MILSMISILLVDHQDPFRGCMVPQDKNFHNATKTLPPRCVNMHFDGAKANVSKNW